MDSSLHDKCIPSSEYFLQKLRTTKHSVERAVSVVRMVAKPQIQNIAILGDITIQWTPERNHSFIFSKCVHLWLSQLQ